MSPACRCLVGGPILSGALLLSCLCGLLGWISVGGLLICLAKAAVAEIALGGAVVVSPLCCAAVVLAARFCVQLFSRGVFVLLGPVLPGWNGR